MTCEKRDSTAESVEDSYLFNICLDLISPAVAPHHLYASESWEELGKKYSIQISKKVLPKSN